MFGKKIKKRPVSVKKYGFFSTTRNDEAVEDKARFLTGTGPFYIKYSITQHLAPA